MQARAEVIMIDKKTQGKKDRAAGKAFELIVRKDLEIDTFK